MIFKLFCNFLMFCYIWNVNECSSSRLIMNWNRNHGILEPPKRMIDAARQNQYIQELQFDQMMDHFDDKNNQTWKQRYFINTEFDQQNGLAFLFIGGESAASIGWMSGGVWIENAAQLGALCFQLEHRFYGESHPTDSASTENFQYLSSEQAIGDLAYFIDAMNMKHNLTENVKWVMFGGSYSGNLAAWVRYKYPDKVFAAISSSAPVEAKLNYWEYMKVVEQSLRTYNPQCADDIKNATTTMENLLMTSDGQDQLVKTFKLCFNFLNNEMDTALLFDIAAGIFANIVQYNNDYSSKSIIRICSKMVNEMNGATPIERYAKVLLDRLKIQNTCLYLSYQGNMNSLRDDSWENQDGGREWFYQTCNEFGYYQTTERNSIFGTKVTLKYYTEQCRHVFGIKQKEIQMNVDNTNKYYDGKDITVTRVLFLQGSIDPWYPLGIINSTKPDMPSIFIQGSSHTADMQSTSIFDSPALQSAKRRVGLYLNQWING